MKYLHLLLPVLLAILVWACSGTAERPGAGVTDPTAEPALRGQTAASPEPQPVRTPVFIVNSQPVHCHESPDAASPAVLRQPPDTVRQADLTVRRPHQVWHRTIDRNCWVRTDTGPVLTFEGREEAENAAAAFRSGPPVTLRGTGSTVTERFSLPSPLSVATFSYDGRGQFVADVLTQSAEYDLVDVEGPFQGQRPLSGGGPIALKVRAAGAWTVRIQPIAYGEPAEFSGTGDTMSDFFDPPASGHWRFVYQGRRHVSVILSCGFATAEILHRGEGPANVSLDVRFGDGPCFWHVRVNGAAADGRWSLTPER